MDSKEMKSEFHQYSVDVINFLDKLEKTTYISTLLFVNNSLSAHQSNGYADWNQRYYHEGRYKDSLLFKLGFELIKIRRGDVSTIIWDDALKTVISNPIDIERRKHNIYHGISFIYGCTDQISIAINVCTGKETGKEEFEDLILPMRFVLLNYFKDM